MHDIIVVREWDADSFHQRVLELESQGYAALRESYRITPEMDPETGNIVHLHTMEMNRASSNVGSGDRANASLKKSSDDPTTR